MLMEMSVLEQKYQAVLAVISDGRSVSEVAEQWGVSRHVDGDQPKPLRQASAGAEQAY